LLLTKTGKAVKDARVKIFPSSARVTLTALLQDKLGGLQTGQNGGGGGANLLSDGLRNHHATHTRFFCLYSLLFCSVYRGRMPRDSIWLVCCGRTEAAILRFVSQLATTGSQ